MDYLFQTGNPQKPDRKAKRQRLILQARITLALSLPMTLLVGSSWAAGYVWNTYPALTLIPIGFVVMMVNMGGSK